MPNYSCVTCGVQYTESEQPPAHCLICEDERQYINREGQKWTTMQAIQQNHKNGFTTLEPNLTAIQSEPRFAIGQQAHLIQTPAGNVLWNCISLIDDDTVAAVEALGGISAITISHPHFYSSMVDWSHAFNNAPIYLHAADRQWVMRPDPSIVFWEGDTQALAGGLTVIRCGGHFPGSVTLHWPAGAEGRGVLLTADTIYLVADTRYVTFMYSYPNMIPLSRAAIEGIVGAIEPFAFDRIYSSWSGTVIETDAKNTVVRSAERYIRAIEGKL